jgi:hypothetical protein
VRQGAGIDERSTAEDVRQAFWAQGLELVVRARETRWHASLRAVPGGGRLHDVASGESADEAARQAAARHLEDHETTGAS